MILKFYDKLGRSYYENDVQFPENEVSVYRITYRRRARSTRSGWLPVFRRYLERNWAVIGVALFSTMSIMSTKIKKAKDDTRKEIPKEKEV